MPNDVDGSGRAPPLSTGQSFTIYLLAVTALSVAIASLYWRTKGSLPLTLLMHAAIDNTTGIVPAGAPAATPGR
jgi:membrane protease YdiL (CAAX protease family)